MLFYNIEVDFQNEKITLPAILSIWLRNLNFNELLSIIGEKLFENVNDPCVFFYFLFFVILPAKF